MNRIELVPWPNQSEYHVIFYSYNSVYTFLTLILLVNVHWGLRPLVGDFYYTDNILFESINTFFIVRPLVFICRLVFARFTIFRRLLFRNFVWLKLRRLYCVVWIVGSGYLTFHYTFMKCIWTFHWTHWSTKIMQHCWDFLILKYHGECHCSYFINQLLYNNLTVSDETVSNVYYSISW